MSKEIIDIIHLIKNKWYNSDIIDIIKIIDVKKKIEIIVLK